MSKILMIGTCNFLTCHNDGGRQVSYKNYKVLCQVFGKENVYLCLITNDVIPKRENVFTLPAYHNIIQQVFFALTFRNGYGKGTEERIIKYVNDNNFDYVWLDRSTIGGLCRKLPRKIKKIVFFHNIEKNYITNKIKYDNIGFFASYPSFCVNEKIATKLADKVICLNYRDADCLEQIYQRKADFLLPVSFDDTFSRKDIVNKISSKLLFVGSYFAPNVKGISWFVDRVMSMLPEVSLTIVGKGMEKKKKEWERENVHVIGTVEDLSPYYTGADAVVLPILFGDGMKVKTAEALMYGKVIFATKEALEGYETDDQPDIFECNTAGEFIEKIKFFYSRVNREGTSEANRKLFLDKYENQSIVKCVVQFFQTLEEE